MTHLTFIIYVLMLIIFENTWKRKEWSKYLLVGLFVLSNLAYDIYGDYQGGLSVLEVHGIITFGFFNLYMATHTLLLIQKKTSDDNWVKQLITFTGIVLFSSMFISGHIINGILNATTSLICTFLVIFFAYFCSKIFFTD